MLKRLIITGIILTGCGADQNPIYYATGGAQWDEAANKADAAQARIQAEAAIIETAIDKANDLLIKKLNFKFRTYLVLFANENLLTVLTKLLSVSKDGKVGFNNLESAISDAQSRNNYNEEGEAYKIYDSSGNLVFDSNVDVVDPNLQDKIDALPTSEKVIF